MTIASEINDLKTNLASAKEAIEAAGGTVSNTGLAGLTASIESIPSGGGGTPKGMVAYWDGLLRDLSDLTYISGLQKTTRLINLPNLARISNSKSQSVIESGGRLSISNLWESNTAANYPVVHLENVPAIHEIYEGSSSLGSAEQYSLICYDMTNLTSYDMTGYYYAGGSYGQLFSGTHYELIENGIQYSNVPLIIGKCPNLTTFNVFPDEYVAQGFFSGGSQLILYPSMYDCVNNPSYNVVVESWEGMNQIIPKLQQGWLMLSQWYNPMGM